VNRATPLWRRYLRFWGADARADIDDELNFHLETRVRELERQGLSEKEARKEAARAFGDVTQIREELRLMNEQYARRTQRGLWLSDAASDLRLGYRWLVRRPWFALGVVLTLALGSAASTTIYGLVHGVLLRPLPYPEGERLVVLWEHNVPRGRTENVVSSSNFEAWRTRARSYSALAGLMPARFTVLGDAPDRIYGGAVSPEWFDIVGVAPRLGHGFNAEEARSRVIVLSHALWIRRYAADPGILGRAIQLEGEPFQVLGVMPEGFSAPSFGWLEEQEFWVPFVADENHRQWGRFLLVLGRLRDGVSLTAAQQELSAIAADLARTDPNDKDWTADVVTLAEQITGDLRTPLLVLLGAVALLQLMAVVNVSSLVLARAQERDLEFSVRAALGAGRRRLLRQLGAEALALVSMGAPLGLLLAIVITRGLTPLLPHDLPRLDSIRIDAAVLGFAAALALVTFLAIGLLPLSRLARGNVEARLRASSARVVRGGGNSAIIIAEIALALTLTIAAGLAMRSFVELRSTEVGFRPDGVISLRLTLGSGYQSDEARALYFERVLEQLARVPGVESVAAGAGRPLSTGVGSPSTTVQLAGTKVELPPVAMIQVITPNYFNTLRTAVLEGRAHSAADRQGSARTFVISRDLAGSLSPDASIIGKRIVVGLFDGLEGEVVGVVDNVRYGALNGEATPAVYIAHAQWPRELMHVLVRSSLPLSAQADALRAAIWSVDRNIPIQSLETLNDVIAQSTARERVNLLILGLFSVVALALSGTGIYGVLALEVGRRRRELGIRLSVGAEPGQLRRMVLARAATTALVGIALGTLLALLATRAMRSMLFGISPTDPGTFAGVSALMLLVALVAAYLPARRATRVDPLLAIRTE
jgi:putative ABC transport system permease protein